MVENDYVLSIRIKGNNPNGSFQLRFLDTKTNEPGDHPWRRSKVINKSLIDWDNKWHEVIIPLSEFRESGSWDDNTWYNPEGKFEWSAVEQFEIATEQMDMGEYSFSFDNISFEQRKSVNVKNRPHLETMISFYSMEGGIVILNESGKELSFNLIDLNGKIWRSGIIEPYYNCKQPIFLKDCILCVLMMKMVVL
ncbi:MAG: hypothetical protein HC906_05460 [Bacteroidales bacterium]|nr:hypothetical protein [Bacteroidales bacterium]